MPLDISDLAAALEARRTKELELNSAPVEGKPTRTLHGAADNYLKEIQATRKKKTYKAYRKALQYFVEAIGDKPLAQVTRPDMIRFKIYLRDTRELAPRSVYNKWNDTMTFLKAFGVKPEGLTKHDTPDYVEEEPEIYEQEELDTFFAACTEQEGLEYEFFLQSGFREQEAIYATDRCLDFENCTVSVRQNPARGWTPKMYKERTVPVSRYLMERLKVMLVSRGKGGLLFPTSNGEPQYHFLERAKVVAKRARMDEGTVWLHKFRATAITSWLRGGLDVRTVMKYAGHTDMKSTLRYLKPQRDGAVRNQIEAIWA